MEGRAGLVTRETFRGAWGLEVEGGSVRKGKLGLRG